MTRRNAGLEDDSMLIPFRNLCRIVIICAALLCLIPAIGAAQTQFSGAIQGGNSTATHSNTVWHAEAMTSVSR
jgi:hypothetical protein